MKQNKRGQMGITIISLVITIVILLILAGIALSISVNEEGLFGKSDTAKKNYLKAQDKESIEFIVMNVMLNNNGIKTFSNMYNAFIEDRDNNRTVLEIIEPENSETETTEIKGKTNNATTQKVKGGIGTAGTSYSGGSGGGGATLNNTDVNFDGGAGTANGGAGGKGVVKYSGSAGSIAAGGAGNPGGNYGLTGQDTNNATTLSKIKGRSGTGGLLIIYGDKVLNNGTISSNGSARRRSRYRYCKNYNRNC